MRGRIYHLAISMALAFCLWLNLVGLDASFVDFTVGLYPHSLPDHLSLKGETPKAVTIRVRANAAQARFLSDGKLGLPLDLSQAREGYNIFPVLLEPLNLPRGVEIYEVNPETIEFEALSLPRKEVPVQPKVVGRPAPGFRLKGLVLEPAAVTIQGPPETLARVYRIETTPLIVDGLTRDAVLVVNAVLPEGTVTIVGSNEIQASVNISEEDRLQAVYADIPVEMEILSDQDQGSRGKASPAMIDPASLIIRPARVSVTISWPSSLGRPVEDEVRAQVMVNGEQLRAERRITALVTAVPPGGAEVTDISPETVEISYAPPADEAPKPRRVKP